MSKRAITFVQSWIFDNVDFELYDPSDTFVTDLVEQLLKDAKSQGIAQEELEEDDGPVGDIVANAVEQATNNALLRLGRGND